MELAVQQNRTAFFDPHRRAALPSIKARIASLVQELEARELEVGLRTKRRGVIGHRKFAIAVEAIVSNVLVLTLLDPNRLLAVPRGHDMMSSRNEVYGSHFIDALDVLAHPSVGIIEQVEKGSKFRPGGPQSTTIRLGPSSKSQLALDAALPVEAFTRVPNPSVLIMKSPKDGKGESHEVQFKETLKTRKLSKQLIQLNEWLSAIPLKVAPDAIVRLNAESDEFIDPTRRTVRRIFNNASWTQGGRLFGGFWENMRRADRFEYLRIGSASHPEGEKIANVDYGQLFPRLAYLRAGTPAPSGDLYDVLGNDEARRGVKRLFNAMLFADGELRNWPRDTSQFFNDLGLRDAISAIRIQHAPIAHLFGTGIGYQLMFTESNLLMEVLFELRGIGISALPLHDSVLVACSEADNTREVLRRRLAEFLLSEEKAAVSIDYGGSKPNYART
ncbi:hypothetical protein [Rhizobium grahamii]|uniref:hypothetical protein n=1 Tax=Rhizobium grahamii TaxID=1120045 RepID=UPI0011B0DD6F|nr:hypothetical protein [Rhizobium grahamii]